MINTISIVIIIVSAIIVVYFSGNLAIIVFRGSAVDPSSWWTDMRI